MTRPTLWTVRAHWLAPAYTDGEASDLMELLVGLEPVLVVDEDRRVGPVEYQLTATLPAPDLIRALLDAVRRIEDAVVAKVYAVHAVPADRAATLLPLPLEGADR